MKTLFSGLEVGQRFKYEGKIYTKLASCAASNERGICVLFRYHTLVEVFDLLGVEAENVIVLPDLKRSHFSNN